MGGTIFTVERGHPLNSFDCWKKEKCKDRFYSSSSNFIVRKRMFVFWRTKITIHFFSEKKTIAWRFDWWRKTRNSVENFLEMFFFVKRNKALETVACLETAPLPVEYGPRAQSAAA